MTEREMLTLENLRAVTDYLGGPYRWQMGDDIGVRLGCLTSLKRRGMVERNSGGWSLTPVGVFALSWSREP